MKAFTIVTLLNRTLFVAFTLSSSRKLVVNRHLQSPSRLGPSHHSIQREQRMSATATAGSLSAVSALAMRTVAVAAVPIRLVSAPGLGHQLRQARRAAASFQGERYPPRPSLRQQFRLRLALLQLQLLALITAVHHLILRERRMLVMVKVCSSSVGSV